MSTRARRHCRPPIWHPGLDKARPWWEWGTVGVERPWSTADWAHAIGGQHYPGVWEFVTKPEERTTDAHWRLECTVPEGYNDCEHLRSFNQWRPDPTSFGTIAPDGGPDSLPWAYYPISLPFWQGWWELCTPFAVRIVLSYRLLNGLTASAFFGKPLYVSDPLLTSGQTAWINGTSGGGSHYVIGEDGHLDVEASDLCKVIEGTCCKVVNFNQLYNRYGKGEWNLGGLFREWGSIFSGFRQGPLNFVSFNVRLDNMMVVEDGFVDVRLEVVDDETDEDYLCEYHEDYLEYYEDGIQRCRSLPIVYISYPPFDPADDGICWCSIYDFDTNPEAPAIIRISNWYSVGMVCDLNYDLFFNFDNLLGDWEGIGTCLSVGCNLWYIYCPLGQIENLDDPGEVIVEKKNPDTGVVQYRIWCYALTSRMTCVPNNDSSGTTVLDTELDIDGIKYGVKGYLQCYNYETETWVDPALVGISQITENFFQIPHWAGSRRTGQPCKDDVYGETTLDIIDHDYDLINCSDQSQHALSLTTPGTYEWTVPVGVTKLHITCQGGGAGGEGGVGDGGAPSFITVGTRGGPAGGRAVIPEVNVTPGDVLTIQVGAGGAGGAGTSSDTPTTGENGGDSYVRRESSSTAAIGTGGSATLLAGGTGGHDGGNSGVGNLELNGGTSSSPTVNEGAFSPVTGKGGGGAPYPTTDGDDSVDQNGANIFGGDGGSPGFPGKDAGAGAGGGGGGSSTSDGGTGFDGGDGGNGSVIIIWTPTEDLDQGHAQVSIFLLK